MNKNQKKIAWGFFIVFTILAIFVLSKVNTVQTMAIPSECYGSILSINKVDVTTSAGDGFFKPRILVTAVAGQGSDCLAISFSKDQINNALKQGDAETQQYIATKDLTNYGYIKLNKYSQNYWMFPDAGLTTDPAHYQFKLTPVKTCITGLTSVTIDKCGTAPSGFWAGVTDISGTGLCSLTQNEIACIRADPVLRKGYWSSLGTSTREATFVVTGLNSVTLSGTTSIPSAILKDTYGNQKALIQWNGDLFGGYTISQPNPYYPVYDKRAGEGIWHFQSQETWGYMTQSYNTYLNYMKSTGDFSQLEFYANAINTTYNSYLKNNEPAYIEQYLLETQYPTGVNLINKNDENIGSQTLSSSPQIQIDLTRQPPTFPTFTITLDAEWAGIYKTVTNPQIQCSQNSVTFNSGGYQDVSISITNNGDGGQVDGSTTCTNGATSQISPTTFPMAKGATASGVARIGAVADGTTDKYGSCTITVQDHTDPSIKSTCNINYQAKALACTPGETKCSPDATQLWSCSFNSQWTQQNCAYGCIVFGGTAKCADAPPATCPTSCATNADCGIDKCGSGYSCYNSKCMKQNPSIECKNCWNWLTNKVGINQCVEKNIWEFKLLDPIGIHRGPSMGLVLTQAGVCPIVILVYTIIILFIIFIIYLFYRNSKKGGRR